MNVGCLTGIGSLVHLNIVVQIGRMRLVPKVRRKNALRAWMDCSGLQWRHQLTSPAAFLTLLCNSIYSMENRWGMQISQEFIRQWRRIEEDAENAFRLHPPSFRLTPDPKIMGLGWWEKKGERFRKKSTKFHD